MNYNHIIKNRRLNEQIGSRIRFYRENNNMTQEQMAEKLSYEPKQYARMERGECSISLEKVQLLYENFGLDPSFVILGIEPVTYQPDVIFKNYTEEERKRFFSMLSKLLNQ